MYARSFFIALLVTFFVTNFSFGACKISHYTYTYLTCGGTCGACSAMAGCTDVEGYKNYCANRGSVYLGMPSASACNIGFTDCHPNQSVYISCLKCDTQAEADSANCSLNGGQWNGTSCIQGDTTSCETYKKECDSMGGKFEGRPLGNTCSASCDVCNSDALKLIKKAWDIGCCNQQLAPPDSVENQICITPFESGEGMTLSTGCLQQDNCNCGVPLNENLEFDYGVYAQKCGSAEGGQDPNSSASEGGSSSSSSSSDSSSVPPQVQVLGLEGLMDSLHKVIYNTAEVDTTTTFMLMCMQNPELYCPSLLGSSSSGDTIIIEGDTTIVNVPSDSAIIAEVRF